MTRGANLQSGERLPSNSIAAGIVAAVATALTPPAIRCEVPIAATTGGRAPQLDPVCSALVAAIATFAPFHLST